MVGLAVVGLVAPGCERDRDRSTDPGPTYPRYQPSTSEANVLANLVTAYRFRGIAPYDALTHPDFVFESSEIDPGVSFFVMTDAQDRASTGAMFAEALSIDVSLEHGAPEPSDVEGYVGPGYSMIFVPQAYVWIELRIDGKVKTLRVEGDPTRFVFIRNEGTTPATYQLIYQKDLHESSGETPSETGSWGGLKSRFYPAGRP